MPEVPAEPKLCPLVRPEIMESFGSWMVADRRPRWPTRRTDNDQRREAGKSRNQATNLGVTRSAVTENQLNVSSRFNALMAIEEGAESKGAEDKEKINERERKEDERGNEENSTIKENEGQLGLKEIRSVRDPRGKKVGRINGAGPREGKKEEWDVFLQPNTGANGLGPGRKDKGKEKAECSMVQLKFNKNHQNVTEGTCEILQPEHMQISTPANNSLIGGVPVLSQPMERDLGPEPPDEVVRMDVSRDEDAEIEQMGKQDGIEEDNLMEEGEVRGPSFC